MDNIAQTTATMYTTSSKYKATKATQSNLKKLQIYLTKNANVSNSNNHR